MNFRQLRSGLWPCFFVILSACGGGSGGGDPVEEEGPVVTSQSDDQGTIQSQNDSTANDDAGVTQSDTPQRVAAGAAIAGSVAEGEWKVYTVPADAQVIVSSLTGDADLFLYSEEVFSDENLLCAAREPFIEDSCSAANAENDQVVAVVYGRESSTYNMSVSIDCSVEAVNEWVYRNMQDYYLYADQVPDVNPASYASPSDLISELRFNELDPYSSVGDAAGQQAFFEEGVTFGFGLFLRREANNNLRVIFVYDDSPLGHAGVRRGDILLGLNNELWDEMSNARYFELVGTQEDPLPNSWQFINGETAEPFSVTLTASEFTVNTVLFTTTATHPSFDGVTGYIVFNEFLRVSEAELDASIAQLIGAGVTELVLDLRYNTGGFTSIARKLASQIGGSDLAGDLLVRYEHNDKYSDEDFERFFEAVSPALNLDRVVVLTTSSTASSSELVINALTPYVDVVVIGEKTEGKAFISAANTFCGRSLNAMKAQGRNVNGVSVAGGITPQCHASDDITRDFGSSSGELEGMLESALDYIVFGRCDVSPGPDPVLAARSAVESNRLSERRFFGSVADAIGNIPVDN